MKIKRQYVTFRVLINSGDEAGKIFLEAFEKSYNDFNKEQIYQMLIDQCLYQRQMGWCFKGLGEVVEAFERLDSEYPFDNGMTYNDVTDMDVLHSDDNSITMLLLNTSYGEKHIVKVVTLEE